MKDLPTQTGMCHPQWELGNTEKFAVLLLITENFFGPPFQQILLLAHKSRVRDSILGWQGLALCLWVPDCF